MGNDKLKKHTINLTEENTLKKVLVLSLKISFNCSLFRIIFIIIIAFFMSSLNTLSNDYVKNTKEIVNNCNEYSLYFIALVFTGYAIFQALLGESTLKMLIEHGKDNISKFKEYNLQFFAICAYILLLLFLNFIIRFSLNNSEVMAFITQQDLVIKFYIKIWFSFIYLFLNLYLFVEMLCFFYNVYQIFTLNAAKNMLEILKK